MDIIKIQVMSNIQIADITKIGVRARVG